MTVTYLEDLKPRNVKKHKEIIEYLLTHKAEIIDYKKRKKVKKTIGSGRAEKGVDLAVAQRQKISQSLGQKKEVMHYQF
jgi:hypothetical protein